MTASFKTLLALDERLAAAGHHPLTPFWRDALQRWYEHPTARTFVGRVGRGGAKSFTSAKIALNETLFGDWKVPPGERHFFAFVSRLKEEVTQRRHLLESFLNALGVEFDTVGDVVQLRDLPLGFRFFACSIAATSGFRCIGFVADEVAKWEADDSYRNPASEVIASLRAMTITHASAREVLISSPWSLDDFHAEAFSRGDTEAQVVASASTWIANPAVTEEQTRVKEPDPKTWAREYAAQPGATESSAFDPEDVAAAFDLKPTGKPRRDYLGHMTRSFVLIDASSLRGDAFTWAAGTVLDTGEIQILAVEGIEGDDLRGVGMTQVVDRIAAFARQYQTRRIFGDQREDAALIAMFGQKGCVFRPFAWSEKSKDEAVQTVRRMLRERQIALPEHPKLRREMLGLRARLLPSGRASYPTNGMDYVSLLVTLGHAVNARTIECAGTPRASINVALERAMQNPARTNERLGMLIGSMIDGAGPGFAKAFARSLPAWCPKCGYDARTSLCQCKW